VSYSKTLPLVLLVASILLTKTQIAFSQSPVESVRWVVEKNSTLRVQGKSNVNSFSCNINEYTEKDTLIFANIPSKPIKLSGDLQMNIESFNCHSSLITSDLRKTLKSKEFPKIIIRFLYLETMPTLLKTEIIKGWIEVELAGVIKRFKLDYSFSTGASGDIQLNGGREFCFSDFKLTPPKKLAGLIKIKDEFNVDFKLTLRSI
jgi:hypothetical protein